MAAAFNLSPLTDALQSDERIAAAVLFGSFARSTARVDSDVDIGVLYASDAARAKVDRELLSVLGRLGQAAGRDVHSVDLATVDSALMRSIIATGKTLFDRGGNRLRDLKVKAMIEYFDWEYARRVIDAGHRRRLLKTDG